MTNFEYSDVAVSDEMDFNEGVRSGAKAKVGKREAASDQVRERAWGGMALNVGIGVCALLAVAGVALWGMQLAGGMVQTGMRNLSSWGLYITMFMFFVGLSAGGLIVASSASVFHVAD